MTDMKYTDRVKRLLEQMTLDEKLQLIHGQLFDKYRGNQAGFVKGIERLHIPDIFICDGESGVDTSWDATAMPAKVALAATFDENAAYEYGRQLGREARDCGMNVILTPRVNIVRDSVTAKNKSNGGNYQTYSEDPLFNGKMGAAEVRGIQENKNAIANAKQLFGSSTGTAQGAGNCIIDEQTMHEIYLKPFEPVIRAGVGSNMTNYNQVNGTWTYKYFDVTQKLCRDRWGFTGFTLDDWLCLYEPEAICGGVSLEMPGSDYYGMGNAKSVYGDRLKQALGDPGNPVRMEHIDRAVGYYLSTLERFDMLDTQRIPGPLGEECKKSGYNAARDIAKRAAVLLKNEDNLLPINPKQGRVAVIGAAGGQQVMPVFKESAYGFKDRRIGIASALQTETDLNVTYAVGDDLEGTPVPLESVKDADGKSGGLTLDLVSYTYPLLGNADLDAPIPPQKRLGRVEKVDFTGENALPVPPDLGIDKSQYDNPIGTPEPYYMWTGKIIAPETGRYRLGMHMSMPGEDKFEANKIVADEMAVVSSGNLYLKTSENGLYHMIGEGVRTAMNGGNCPHSEVLPCRDGFNNVGGFVHLESGVEYDFIAIARSMYKEPVEARLCWVTPSQAEKNLFEAEKAAKNADIAIVCAWHKTSESLNLTEGQEKLIERVAAANPNTVVVLNNGDPVIMPWSNKVKGILEMWYSGQEGALATVDVLCGKYNPAGRLPVTFPEKLPDTACHEPGHEERVAEPGRMHRKDWIAPNVAVFSEGINLGYRHFDKKGIEPAFEFGFGLSYTRFEYTDLNIEKTLDCDIAVQCKVTNTGNIDGEEAVQCYLTCPGTVPQGVQVSPQTLADFKRVAIAAGQSVQVSLVIPQQSLCYWKARNENNHWDEGEGWEVLHGERTIRVGASSRDIRLEQTIIM